jgi:hypothetical protein
MASQVPTSGVTTLVSSGPTTVSVPPSSILPSDPRVQPGNISGSVPWNEALLGATDNPGLFHLVQSANSYTGWLFVQQSGPSNVVTGVPGGGNVTEPVALPPVQIAEPEGGTAPTTVSVEPGVVQENLNDQWGQLLSVVQEIVAQVIQAVSNQQAVLNRITRQCCRPVSSAIASQQQMLIPPLTQVQSDCQRRLNEQAIRIDLMQQLLNAPPRPIQVQVQMQYPAQCWGTPANFAIDANSSFGACTSKCSCYCA